MESRGLLYLMPRSKFCAAAAALLLLHAWIVATAETLQFSLVSQEGVEDRLRKYTGDNKQRETTLKQMFTDAGCDGQHISEQPVKGSKLPNVISLLPSLYEAMKIKPRKHTYIFIGFTDEEKSLVGSHYYVRQMTKEQVAAADAMVNMDTLGLAPSEVWATHSDQWLIDSLAYIANQLNVPITGVNVDQIGSSDAESFTERKIPRITIHSLTQETWNARILHTSKDKLSAMRLDDYYQTYRLLAAYAAYLDQVVGIPAKTTTH